MTAKYVTKVASKPKKAYSKRNKDCRAGLMTISIDKTHWERGKKQSYSTSICIGISPV